MPHVANQKELESPWVAGQARPLIIGHRGAPRKEPENTLASFQAALDSGADGIEIDVQQTADSQLAVYHDTHIVINGHKQSVASLSLQELRERGHPDGDNTMTRRVPTLVEVLQAFPGTLINIELKSFSLRSTGLERQVVEELMLVKERNRILVSSFNPIALTRVRRLSNNLLLGLLTSPDLPRPLSHAWFMSFLGEAAAIHPRHDGVEPFLCEEGRLVNAWTVNSAGRALELHQLGVNALITDTPEKLRRAFKA